MRKCLLYQEERGLHIGLEDLVPLGFVNLKIEPNTGDEEFCRYGLRASSYVKNGPKNRVRGSIGDQDVDAAVLADRLCENGAKS